MKSQGIFQVNVINLHRPALLVISQDSLHRQAEVCADEVLGEFIPGAFFGDDCVDRFCKAFQMSLDETGEVGGCFVLLVHSLERDPLIRLVPERQVVLVNTYFVNPPVRLDGTDDLPLLPATILDQFLARSIARAIYPFPEFAVRVSCLKRYVSW